MHDINFKTQLSQQQTKHSAFEEEQASPFFLSRASPSPSLIYQATSINLEESRDQNWKIKKPILRELFNVIAKAPG